MRLTLKAAAVLVLTVMLAKLAYVLPLLGPLFDSNAWQRCYVALATWFNVDGPEQGDNLVLVVILGGAFLLSLLLVSAGSRYVIGPLHKSLRHRRSSSR